MITFDSEKCTRCGLCIDLCHESCITLTADGPQVDSTVCSTCTQCIAACPRRAVAWKGIPPVAFEHERLPNIEQLNELFQERRSIRRFKREKIDRSVLEEIVRMGAYAPTHVSNLRAIIVDDDDLITVLDQAIVANCRWIYRLAYQSRIGAALAGLFGYADEMGKARPKIEATLAMGHAFHSLPAAFILMIGAKRGALGSESAQYALANMMYAAQLNGVGSCLWANGPIFIDRHREARRRLGMESHERIYGAMYLGYPAVKFSNKVRGKVLPVSYNGS